MFLIYKKIKKILLMILEGIMNCLFKKISILLMIYNILSINNKMIKFINYNKYIFNLNKSQFLWHLEIYQNFNNNTIAYVNMHIWFIKLKLYQTTLIDDPFSTY